MDLLRSALSGHVRGTLRKQFRRIIWSGSDAPPSGRPIVVYANHHFFYDGYILGYLLESVLRRRVVIWMQDLGKFPFFKAGGAMPFAAENPAERFATIRATSRMMRRDPNVALVYFPERRLHDAGEGIQFFDPNLFTRLDRVFPTKYWWPVALQTVHRHRARPTVVVQSGVAHEDGTGAERKTLQDLLTTADREEGTRSVILEGRRDPDERWDFSRLSLAGRARPR